MSQYSAQLGRHSQEILRDYQHAARTYLDNGYALTPKFGFQYYCVFNINPDAIIDKTWLEKGRKQVGILVKKADLPKFTISTETLNQYNRRTVVQTKLGYGNVSVEFHDDNSGVTHNLWLNYFKYYYADSNYGVKRNYSVSLPEEYRNNKYGVKDNTYGIYDTELENTGTGSSAKDVGFFRSIDIYVMHLQKEYTKFTLVNPKITEWAHDNVSQSEGGKILQNRMQLAYETVFYEEGFIEEGIAPEGWTPDNYDKTTSPLSVGGNRQNAVIGKRPVQPTLTNAAERRPAYATGNTRSPFDQPLKPPKVGTASRRPNSNLALDIGKALATNYLNKKGLGRLGPIGYNIAGGVLGGVQGVTNPAGKYSTPPSQNSQPGILNLPGGAGINLFKGLNTSVDGKIRANPAAVILPKR